MQKKNEAQALRIFTPEDACLLLVVEDDSIVRDLFSIWQETGRWRQSVRMQLANSCEEALKLLAATSFEVVLLDLTLGDSHGLQTLDRITDFVKDRIPVIVFTGGLPPGVSEDDIFSHHAADIIFKPGPGIDELMRLIHYAASRHRIRVQYLNMIESLSTEYEEAKAEISKLRSLYGSQNGLEESSVPTPGILRLERIIGRIGKLAMGS